MLATISSGAQPLGLVTQASKSKAATSCYAFAMNQGTGLDAYKIVLYRQNDGSWVAEVPAIAGCYALMPTREEALAELGSVFNMITEEFLEKGVPLPKDTTEIVNA
jgi:predicted RNase H-like HicB family nuclease